MKLMGKKILIEQQLSAGTTEGGLALPETMQRGLPRGKVIKEGPNVSTLVNVGDIIQFNELGAINVELITGKYLLIEEEDVLLILEDGE